MKESFRIRLSTKFAEYRTKKLFIDCFFTENNEKILAHKILLAKNSKILSSFFLSHPNKLESLTEILIPFDLNSLFSSMVDFFYNHTISHQFIFNDPIPLYIMSIVYNVSSLTLILNDIINDTLCIENALTFISHYRNLSINSTYLPLFPGILDSFNRMITDSLKFAPFIASHFHEFSNKRLYESISPYFLAEVLKNTNFEDKKKISIIDEYCSVNGIPDAADSEKLAGVIDWTSENSFEHFVYNTADWVPAPIARKQIGLIFDHRKNIINSMIDHIKDIKTDINNWYLISWISSISQSGKSTEISNCNLIDFIGTFGGIIDNPINPTLYRLLKTKASLAVQIPQYRESLFDRECYAATNDNHYYLSFPDLTQTKPQFIGYEFETKSYIPKQIIYRPVPDKCYPKNIVVKGLDEKNDVIYESPIISIENDRDVVHINVKVETPVKSVVMEMVGLNSGGINCLRASHFDVNGVFSPA